MFKKKRFEKVIFEINKKNVFKPKITQEKLCSRKNIVKCNIAHRLPLNVEYIPTKQRFFQNY